MSHSIAGCASTARFIFPTSARRTISQRWVPVATFRTFLLVPLRQQGELIGVLIARRTEVRPFTPAQIKLLETFADQAVIAIENVRLFKELQERNRDLTEAWSSKPRRARFCGVIASSPTDLQPVLEALQRALHGCVRRHDALIGRVEGDILRLNAALIRTPPGGSM